MKNLIIFSYRTFKLLSPHFCFTYVSPLSPMTNLIDFSWFSFLRFWLFHCLFLFHPIVIVHRPQNFCYVLISRFQFFHHIAILKLANSISSFFSPMKCKNKLTINQTHLRIKVREYRRTLSDAPAHISPLMRSFISRLSIRVSNDHISTGCVLKRKVCRSLGHSDWPKAELVSPPNVIIHIDRIVIDRHGHITALGERTAKPPLVFLVQIYENINWTLEFFYFSTHKIMKDSPQGQYYPYLHPDDGVFHQNKTIVDLEDQEVGYLPDHNHQVGHWIQVFVIIVWFQEVMQARRRWLQPCRSSSTSISHASRRTSEFHKQHLPPGPQSSELLFSSSLQVLSESNCQSATRSDPKDSIDSNKFNSAVDSSSLIVSVNPRSISRSLDDQRERDIRDNQPADTFDCIKLIAVNEDSSQVEESKNEDLKPEDFIIDGIEEIQVVRNQFEID
jgi:hypothetical protein